MIYAVPFEAGHFASLNVQTDQAWLTRFATDEGLKALEGQHACTWMDDGLPVACAGVIAYWEGRGMAWSFLSDGLRGAKMLKATKEARAFLDGVPFRRLEASVDVRFEKAHRWIRMLGFTMETPLQRKFQIDGSDTVGYVRIKE